LFVYAFDVLKGDGKRGTTIKAAFSSGQTVSIDPSRRTKGAMTVTKRTPEGVPIDFHSPSSRAVKKMLKQVSATQPGQPTRMEYMSRQDQVNRALEFGIRQFPGILKIAFHCVAAAVPDEIRLHDAAVEIGRIVLFGRSPRGLVKWIPLESIDWGIEKYNHSILAWQDDNAVVVGVNLFGFLPLAVKLDDLRIPGPCLLTQRIDNGHFSMKTVPTPNLDWRAISGDLTPMLRKYFEDAKLDAERMITLKNISDQVLIALLLALHAGRDLSSFEEIANNKLREAIEHAEQLISLSVAEKAELTLAKNGAVKHATEDSADFEKENAFRIDY
jgi:hypothetical protein